MIDKKEKAILDYYFKFMISNPLLDEFLQQSGFGITTSKKKDDLIEALEQSEIPLTKLSLTQFARKKCTGHFYDLKQQREIIQSDLLDGHNWFEASPSRLHLTMQNWVRLFLDKKISFQEYIDKIVAIGKQEAYMLIGANITEFVIFQASEEVLPTLRSKSISDVVLGNFAYDIKNTHVPRTAPANLFDDPNAAIEWLFDSGDLLRDLKTAAKGAPDQAYNRIYIIVDPVEKWKTHFDEIWKQLTQGVKDIISGKKKPHVFERDKNGTQIHVTGHIFKM